MRCRAVGHDSPLVLLARGAAGIIWGTSRLSPRSMLRAALDFQQVGPLGANRYFCVARSAMEALSNPTA